MCTHSSYKYQKILLDPLDQQTMLLNAVFLQEIKSALFFYFHLTPQNICFKIYFFNFSIEKQIGLELDSMNMSLTYLYLLIPHG